MKIKLILAFLFLSTLTKVYSQKTNSETRKFIDNTEMIKINKDLNVKTEFITSSGEIVSFFPVEVIDLKSNNKIISLQMDMRLTNQIVGVKNNDFKSLWIDLNEVDELISFIEQYVIPNLKSKTERKQSETYIFNSREIRFSFCIQKSSRELSIYLKDNGIIDFEHYFETESQVIKISELLTMLKEIK